MAGGTKSYLLWMDDEGAVRRDVVSFHPKFALKPKAALAKVRDGEFCHLAPGDLQAFERELGAATKVRGDVT
jgi:phosphatidylethanolamine-binding protein (PEBP) family uncharacterized protein